MKRIVNPIDKVGTLFIRPNWRMEALQNPAKYKMQDFVSIPKSGSACLRRFIANGLSYTVNYKIPPLITDCLDLLNDEGKKRLLYFWRASFKKSKQKKVSVDSDEIILAANPVWNIPYVSKLTDPVLKRLIYHHSNYIYDHHIAKAIEYSRSSEVNEIFKFIGYCLYAKVSHEQIALRWNQPVKTAEAIKDLFYDFSRFPKDRMANFSYLRQLTNSGLFSDTDFAYYKRAYELGELGLKAHTDYYNLSPSEKQVISDFLGKTVIANTLNIHFSIKNQKDAINYGLVVSNLANYYIREAEMTYFASKTRNLNACTRRIEGELIDDNQAMTALDQELLAVLKTHSLQDERVTDYKTLDALK